MILFHIRFKHLNIVFIEFSSILYSQNVFDTFTVKLYPQTGLTTLKRHTDSFFLSKQFRFVSNTFKREKMGIF